MSGFDGGASPQDAGRVREEADGLATRPIAVPSMQVRDVHKAFGDTEILRGLTLDFADNAITTILGPSGTGKSVLIKHLVGLLRPDRGDVHVFGKDIWKMSEDDRYEARKDMGVLFQDGALLGSMNVYDNIAFPLRKHSGKSEDEIREIVRLRMDEVGLARIGRRYPSQLSGGMKKRAGFARALVTEPRIVFFDEPDSGLDPVRTTLLNDLILRVHAEHGGTYLLVTHDIETARKVSDKVGLIWKGKVVHYGDADDVFNSDIPFVRQFLSGSSAGPLGMD